MSRYQFMCKYTFWKSSTTLCIEIIMTVMLKIIFCATRDTSFINMLIISLHPICLSKTFKILILWNQTHCWKGWRIVCFFFTKKSCQGHQIWHPPSHSVLTLGQPVKFSCQTLRGGCFSWQLHAGQQLLKSLVSPSPICSWGLSTSG